MYLKSWQLVIKYLAKILAVTLAKLIFLVLIQIKAELTLSLVQKYRHKTTAERMNFMLWRQVKSITLLIVWQLSSTIKLDTN